MIQWLRLHFPTARGQGSISGQKTKFILDETKDSIGRAKVDFSSGSQVVTNGETVNRMTKKVTIRTKPTWTEKLSMLRIIIDGDAYRILAKDVRGRDMATIFTVELINE